MPNFSSPSGEVPVHSSYLRIFVLHCQPLLMFFLHFLFWRHFQNHSCRSRPENERQAGVILDHVLPMTQTWLMDVTLSSALLSNHVHPWCHSQLFIWVSYIQALLSGTLVSGYFWLVTAFVHLQCHASKAISRHALSKLPCSGTLCPLCHNKHSKILPVYCFHPVSWVLADQIFSMTC